MATVSGVPEVSDEVTELRAKWSAGSQARPAYQTTDLTSEDFDTVGSLLSDRFPASDEPVVPTQGAGGKNPNG